MRWNCWGLVAAVALGACSGGGAGPSGPVATTRAERFRVLYEVTRTAAPGQRDVVWQVLTVQRPLASSDLTFRTRPRELRTGNVGTPVNGNVSDALHLYSVDASGLHRVAGRQPGLPSGDLALEQVARDAVRRNAARIGDQRTIAAHRCTEITLLEPAAGPLDPLAGSANRDEYCVTADGIVLAERWTLNGRVVEEREAKQVLVGDALPDDVLATALATDSAEDVTAQPGTPRVAAPPDAVTPPAPTGFALAVSVQFFLPQTNAPDQLAYASRVWAFQRAGDLITVERGSGLVKPWRDDQARTRTIDGRAVGWVVRSDGTEVHFDTPDGWVRVRGTRPLARLLPFVRAVSNWVSSSAAVPR